MGIGNRESGIGNRESGSGKREAGSGKREAGSGSGKREAGSGKREAGSGKRDRRFRLGHQRNRMAFQSYRDLEVWQVAMDLAELSYKTTRTFPKEELFGMTSQIRRAASSIPANIAEGRGRDHTKEFIHSIGVARGSLLEVETHLILGCRVGFLGQPKLDPLLNLSDRVGRMLTALKKSLQKRL